MAIYSYASFGYEGSLVTVEVDIKDGESGIDIVGLSDAEVNSARQRLAKALGSSLPDKRVFISLSPADLKKEGTDFDLPMALAVMAKVKENEMPRSQDANVFVMGELGPDGNVLRAHRAYAALSTAKEAGIKYAILPEGTERLPDGVVVHKVKNITEAFDALCNVDEGEVYQSDMVNPPETHSNGFYNHNDSMVTFAPLAVGEKLIDVPTNGCSPDDGLIYALAIAAAGKHNILVYGEPAKNRDYVTLQIAQFLPNLSVVEQPSVNRIYSLAGLAKPDSKIVARPFRIPHPTASIEGICGGGPKCNPGEVSLAHNGVLFLKDAAEFKTSVLQILSAPIDSKNITLSRAGRSTTYPADFQLVMTMNSCPCGYRTSHSKACLCSQESINQYWKKLEKIVIDRVSIRYNSDSPINPMFTGDVELRERIKQAVAKQRNRQGKYNNDLSSEEIAQYCKLSDKAREALGKATQCYGYSKKTQENIIRLARTVLDLKAGSWDEIGLPSMSTALVLYGRIPVANL